MTQLSICCISQTMIFSNYYDYFGVIINTKAKEEEEEEEEEE